MTQTSTLYLNENVAIQLVALLSQRGIEAVHTLNVGNRGVSDEVQLEYAAKQGYILLTHNRRHFRRLHRVWVERGQNHAGIIVVGYAEPERLAERVHLFFERVYPTATPPFCIPPPRIE